MKTIVIPSISNNAIKYALQVLKDGGLVAFPTDTVYGVGALVFDGQAVESIYTAKDRPIEKAIPVLLADTIDMEQVGQDIPDITYKLASRFWPGPLTCLIPKRLTIPESVSVHPTVGVRVPDHGIARALLRAAGPMAVTSANISGGQNPTTAQEVFTQLNGRVPLIIDGGKTTGGKPSTLIDCSLSELVILREGPVSLEEIMAKLSSPI